MAAFYPSIHNGFVDFDDGLYVYENVHVQAGLTWDNMLWAFRTGHASNWHPLTWLSLMLDVQWFGTGPAGLHFTNVLLHSANAVLLLLLLRRLTGMLWPGAFVAMLFAVHPLHVETVAWVSERKDVLSGFFFMLTLWAYARYSQCVTNGTQQVTGATVVSSSATRPPSLFYFLALWFFALGLMSKPMLVTLPFVLLLLDCWPLRRIENATVRHLVLEKLPFVALSIVSCIATLLAQQNAIKSNINSPFSLRCGNALTTCVTYLVQMFWPRNLAVLYPYHHDTPVWQYAGAGILLFSLTLLAVFAWRRFPVFMVGWLWYLGMLVPVIGLVQVGNQSHADRYTYLPQIGLYIAIVWGVMHLTVSWQWRRPIFGVTALVVMTVLTACTWNQISYWRNGESLWEHTLACTTKNSIAHNYLGYALAAQGRITEAIEQYQAALDIDPHYADAENNLGMVFLNQGRLDEAAEHFRRAIEYNPDLAAAHNNLGIVLTKQDRITEAIVEYQRAVELDPDLAATYNNLGKLLFSQGRTAEAIGYLQKALKMNPRLPEPHFNLGLFFADTGQLDEAVGEFEAGLKLAPDNAQALYYLSITLDKQGRFVEAAEQLQTILKTDPNNAMAHCNLGILLGKTGRLDEAITEFKEAIKLQPDYADARANLATALSLKAVSTNRLQTLTNSAPAR